MIKRMVINIDINTENHTPQMVKNLILELVAETGNRCFAIENVTIDGEENFKIGTGFMGDMAKKFI